VDTKFAMEDRPMGVREPPTDLLSVIVPHFNDLDNLRLLLSLLADQTLSPDRFEVIVADNNSGCGLAAVGNACGARARVVSALVQGAAAARNAGIAASRGKVLAFIDSDCRPAREWLAYGLAALERAEIVGGGVTTTAEDEHHPSAVEAYEKIFAFDNERYVEREGFSVTANMFVPRAVFDRVGGFRAGVSEDKDWGRRAMALGYRWSYAPRAEVSHPARKNWDELCGKWRRITRDSYNLEKEKPFGRARWMWRAWGVLVSPFVHIFRALRTPRHQRPADRLKAIGVLFRLRAWRFVESYQVLASDLLPS
jgi:glycosyltransferase involved in cell wall biosynthesis